MERYGSFVYCKFKYYLELMQIIFLQGVWYAYMWAGCRYGHEAGNMPGKYFER